MAIAVSIVLLPGCLERRETLTIQPDGSVLVILEFDARSRGELQEGDAIPVLAGGWQIGSRTASSPLAARRVQKDV